MITNDIVIKNIIFSLYLYEIIWQSRLAIRYLENVLNIPELESDEIEMRSGTETQGTIATALSHAANVKKLLKPHPGRFDTEDTIKIKEIRKSFFDKLFVEVQFTELLNAGTRNGLEHFDDKIDELLDEVLKGTNVNKSLLYDVEINSFDFFEFNRTRGHVGAEWSYMAKVYVTSEKNFYHAGRKVHLVTLCKELGIVKDRVTKLIMLENDERELGSVILTLPHASR